MNLNDSRRLVYLLKERLEQLDNSYKAGALSKADYHMKRIPVAVALAHMSIELNQPVNYSVGL